MLRYSEPHGPIPTNASAPPLHMGACEYMYNITRGTVVMPWVTCDLTNDFFDHGAFVDHCPMICEVCQPSARLLSFCCTPPLPSAGVSIGMKTGCQQNDGLADGYKVCTQAELALVLSGEDHACGKN